MELLKATFFPCKEKTRKVSDIAFRPMPLRAQPCTVIRLSYYISTIHSTHHFRSSRLTLVCKCDERCLQCYIIFMNIIMRETHAGQTTLYLANVGNIVLLTPGYHNNQTKLEIRLTSDEKIGTDSCLGSDFDGQKGFFFLLAVLESYLLGVCQNIVFPLSFLPCQSSQITAHKLTMVMNQVVLGTVIMQLGVAVMQEELMRWSSNMAIVLHLATLYISTVEFNGCSSVLNVLCLRLSCF